MKSYLKTTTILPLAVMFLTTAFAGIASAAAKDIQLKGSLSALESNVFNPGNPPIVFPTLAITLEGTGCASHLGFYSLSIDETVTLPALSSQGTFALEAGCGDTLSGTVLGQATLNADGSEASIVELLTITGGTGRFKHATGTLTTHRLLNRATGVSSGTIAGAIGEEKGRHGHAECSR